MAQTPQTYKNHARWLPAFHFFVLPVLLLNFLNAGRHIWMTPTLKTTFAGVVAAALFAAALLSRMMVVTVQDRVIRLEMRLRLRELLPADLQGRVGELTREQFVALRFASDAELPELVRQVLGGSPTTRKDIKLKVKNWTGDHLRA